MFLLIGVIIGVSAGVIMNNKIPASWLVNSIAGIAGACVANIGVGLFGQWGPAIGATAIVPTLVSSLFFVVLISFLARMVTRRNYI